MNVDELIAKAKVDGAPNEHEAKRLLASFGVATPAACFLCGGRYAAPDFDGPYVVKVAPRAVMHKTEAGGVRVGVSAEGLPEAVTELALRFPGEDLLVEEFVNHAGVEIIAGAFRDAALGPALMVGRGGTLAEIDRDVSFRLIPLDRRDVEEMLDELRIAPVLRGYRNLGLDRAALVDLLTSISDLVVSLGRAFVELDVNPLVSSKGRWVALDCKLAIDP